MIRTVKSNVLFLPYLADSTIPFKLSVQTSMLGFLIAVAVKKSLFDIL